jgi:hypothetical protein
MIWKISYLTMIALFCGISKAEAYLDPGTGSMIIQALIAAFAAAAVFWRSILSSFKRFFKKESNELEQ